MSVDPTQWTFPEPGVLKTTAYPPPGMYLDGTGDYASTPDGNTLDITGDIDIRVAFMNLSNSGSEQVLLAKSDSATQRSYCVTTTGYGGAVVLHFTSDGATPKGASVSGLSAVAGQPVMVRATLQVNDGAGHYVVKFYTRPFYFTTYAADLADDTIAAGAWVQLGATVTTAGATSIFSSTSTLRIGDSGNNWGIAPFLDLQGAVYAAVVKNGIAGTAVANPDFGIQTDATTAFADAAGLTWSMNGDAYMIPGVMDGWLLCDGASLDTTTYADLFSVIRYRHGGSGTSFNIPDSMKSNRFIRGGFNVGNTGGVATHSYVGNNTATGAGASQRILTIDGLNNGSFTFDNQPPFTDEAIWIKT